MALEPACVVPVKYGNVSLDNGHLARGVALVAGDQNLAFRIDCWTNNTYAYGSNCLRGGMTAERCVTFRGGLYRQLESPTRGRVNQSRIAKDDEETDLEWSSEVLALTNNQKIDDFPLAVPLSELGGDQSYAPLNLLGLGPNSTVLGLLYEAGKIPSRTWSYFSGRSGATRDAQLDGLVVFGGYDRAKVQGDNITARIDYSDIRKCRTGLVVTITDMTMNFANGTDLGIFTKDSPLSVCLDPTGIGLMSIPFAGILENFNRASPGLDFYTNAGRSFGLNYYTMLYENQTFAYNGDLSVVIDGKMKIRIPNNQLVVPDLSIEDSGEIVSNSSRPNLIINSLQDVTADVPPSLGEAFFSSLSLLVNHDSGEFSIWQARATSERDLVPIGPDHAEATCTAAPTPAASSPAGGADSNTGSGSNNGNGNSNSGMSLSTGAIAGVAVGGAAALALVGLAIFFLVRRRKQKQPYDATGSGSSGMHESQDAYGLYAQPKYHYPPQEMPSREAFRSPVELPGEFPNPDADTQPRPNWPVR